MHQRVGVNTFNGGGHSQQAGLVGAVVKDPVQDSVIWQEYLETVMRTRKGWGDLYDACRELS